MGWADRARLARSLANGWQIGIESTIGLDSGSPAGPGEPSFARASLQGLARAIQESGDVPAPTATGHGAVAAWERGQAARVPTPAVQVQAPRSPHTGERGAGSEPTPDAPRTMGRGPVRREPLPSPCREPRAVPMARTKAGWLAAMEAAQASLAAGPKPSPGTVPRGGVPREGVPTPIGKSKADREGLVGGEGHSVPFYLRPVRRRKVKRLPPA